MGPPDGGPSAKGEARNAACRDFLVLYLRQEAGQVAAAGFKATGCPAVMGMGSAATELLPGLAWGPGLAAELRQRFVERYGEPGALHRHALALVEEAVTSAL